MSLDQQAREKLTQILRGRHDIVDEFTKCKGLLLDYPVAIQDDARNLLLHALGERIPQTLRQHRTGVDELTFRQLVGRLVSKYRTQEGDAAWAVETWATALDVTLRRTNASQIVDTPNEIRFRGMVELAFDDGILTAEEISRLEVRRDDLNISPGRADAIIAETRSLPRRAGVAVTPAPMSPPPPGGSGVAWAVLLLVLLFFGGVAAAGWWYWPQISAYAGQTPRPGPAVGPSVPPARQGIDLATLQSDVDREIAANGKRTNDVDALSVAAVRNRATLSADLPDFANFKRRLETGIQRADDENHWPLKMAERQFTADAARAALSRLTDELAARQKSLDAIDALIRAAADLRVAGFQRQNQLNGLRAVVRQQNVTPQRLSDADALLKTLQAEADVEARDADATLHPMLATPATLDSLL